MMMHTIRVATLLSATTILGFGQDPVVAKSTIWLDTVKRGDMIRTVRALGMLGANKTAELRIPESQVRDVKPGQAAHLDTRNGMVNGQVRRVVVVTDGPARVEVAVEDALPKGAVPGLNVDGTIDLEILKDVVYVGRPVMGTPQSNGVLFKRAADGQYATRVTVQYGRASVNTIEVVSGLQPGDQVILSDMSAYATKERVRLQ